YASHSPHVDILHDHLIETLADITPRQGEIAFYSTVTGRQLDTTHLTADYWYTNLRHTMQLERAIASLHHDGHRIFIEVSPHPVLTTAIQDTAHTDTSVIGTLRREHDGTHQFLIALAHAHACGTRVDWTPALPHTTAHVDLPTYPFQRQHHWLNNPTNAGAPSSLGQTAAGHPLLGAAIQLAGDDTLVLT